VGEEQASRTMTIRTEKSEETANTWAEILRLRGYDEKFIEAAIKRRQKHLKCN
jgi:hypothetical protein